MPPFFIDSLPGVPGAMRRNLVRSIGIEARAHDIFIWLTQLRVAPYSYDFIDNGRRKSPGFIIENLPPLRINTHFLLAFHVSAFKADSFIACRYCEPVNPPFSLCLQGLHMEYRIEENGLQTTLWCKISGFIRRNALSRLFFSAFSLVNKIMMKRQLKTIKKYSELAFAGKAGSGKINLAGCYPRSRIHWWIFCRRHGCTGLIN